MLKLATKFAPERAAFEQALHAGFHNVELFLNEVILHRWEAVVPLARYYPFRYVLHCPNRKEIAAETLRQMVELYRALDCRALVIHQPQFDRYGEELARLAPELRPAVENHALPPDQFDAWATRNAGLTFDVEHLWKYTLRDAPRAEFEAAARRFLERWGDKVLHVHMPGYLPGYPEHRPMYCSRDLVFSMLSLLADRNFDGLIVSEVNLPFQNPTDLRMDTLLFQRWREERESHP